MGVDGRIQENIDAKEKLKSLAGDIENMGESIVECLKAGNKILIAGNGGSAADAQHMAAELVGRFRMEREGLPCIALTTDSSILTSVGNDYGFDSIFERQIESLGRQGDIFIGISTSGKSENIIRAVKKAESIGIETQLLLGGDGGALGSMGSGRIIAPSDNTPRIQECHMLIIHIICSYIEEMLFGSKEGDSRGDND